MFRRLRYAVVALVGLIPAFAAASPAGAFGEVITPQVDWTVAVSWDSTGLYVTNPDPLFAGDCVTRPGATLHVSYPDGTNHAWVTYDATTYTAKTSNRDIWRSWFGLMDYSDNALKWTVPFDDHGNTGQVNSPGMSHTYADYDTHAGFYIPLTTNEFWAIGYVEWMGHC